MIEHNVSEVAHGQMYAMIANFDQASICDNRHCDNRRRLVHGSMTPDEIKAELERRNMSQRDLADAIGMSENYLSKSLRGIRIFKLAEMDAIRAELAPEPEGSESRLRTIPLLGSVPAGKFSPGEQRGGRRIAVADPEIPRNAFALTVQGDSMDLIVPSGTVLIIDPDDKDLWPGRRYVVQTIEGDTTYKEFRSDPARLVPCSSNPVHQVIPLGSEPIVIVGRVFSYSMRDADLPMRSA